MTPRRIEVTRELEEALKRYRAAEEKYARLRPRAPGRVTAFATFQREGMVLARLVSEEGKRDRGAMVGDGEVSLDRLAHIEKEIVQLVVDGVISMGRGAEVLGVRLLEMRELAAKHADVQSPGEEKAAEPTHEAIARTCRVCGCTDEWGCDGGCLWVEEDLCSQCAPASGETGGEA